MLFFEPSHQLLSQNGPSTFETPLTFPSLRAACPQASAGSSVNVWPSGRNWRLEPPRAKVSLRLPGYLPRPPDATMSASASCPGQGAAEQPRAKAWELGRCRAHLHQQGSHRYQVPSTTTPYTPANLGWHGCGQPVSRQEGGGVPGTLILSPAPVHTVPWSQGKASGQQPAYPPPGLLVLSDPGMGSLRAQEPQQDRPALSSPSPLSHLLFLKRVQEGSCHQVPPPSPLGSLL